MKILTRYVCLELTKVFLVTLSGMTAMMLIVGLVQEAIRQNLTPLTILQLIPFVVPNALCFAIPGTILFSTCMVLGRMASNNEITAVKAMGISPMAVVWPVIVMAFGLSIVTVYLNDLAVSWGRGGVYRVVLNSVEKTIYAVLHSQRSYQNGRVAIFVDDVQDDLLIRPVVHIYGEDNQGDFQFSAESARLSVDPEKDVLIFSVRNALANLSEEGFNAVLPDGDVPIPLRNATRRETRDESPSNLPLRVMRGEIQRQNERNDTQRRQLAMQAAFQMLGGDFVSLTHPRWPALISDLANGQERVYRLQTEPWRRWANGFSCLCFVMVGAPLAIYLRRSDFWNTFAMCFIPILIVYYPLLMFGVGNAKSGDMPPPIVWLGNIVLLLVGWWLTRKIVRN
ncbi:MAG: LptF/LptG family permease [Pirellulaceae bacterium]